MDHPMSFKSWSKTIESIEDAVSGLLMDLDSFRATYGPLLDELDGTERDMRMDYYFEHSPLNKQVLRCLDTTREEWIEWAMAMDCIPSMKEICEGEDEIDKKKRKDHELKIAAQKKQSLTVNTHKQRRKMYVNNPKNKIDNIISTIAALDNKIASATDQNKDIYELVQKRERAYLLLNKFSEVTM